MSGALSLDPKLLVRIAGSLEFVEDYLADFWRIELPFARLLGHYAAPPKPAYRRFVEDGG